MSFSDADPGGAAGGKSPASQKACDEVSRYVRSKRIDLARQIQNKKKVYLDTKYWVLLREVRLGRNDDASLKLLLERLEHLVDSGNVICPLNADIYFEVLKQNDPATITATVELIDALSDGICFIPMVDRLPLEVYHFIIAHYRGADAVHSLNELVWTRAAYVIGFATPDCYNLSYEQNLTVQKAFADQLWQFKLGDYLNVMGAEEAARHVSPFADISSELNQGKLGSIDEHKSFKSVFLSEVAGVLDAYESEIADLTQHIYEREMGIEMDAARKAQDKSGRLVANMIYNLFAHDKVPNQFPTIHISAGLHAAVRWDRNRKYKATDMFDFRHAEAALPYCDYFFTERSLRHLLQDRNLKLQDKFRCVVCAEPQDAVSALATIPS